MTILSTLPSAGLGAVAHLDAVGTSISSVIARHRHHPAHRHRREERHHAGRLRDPGSNAIDGVTAEESIREACRLRFRPIMMTTMAAILGGVPLMLGTGTGSELRQPLGYAMVGGLMLSSGTHAVHDAGRLSLSRSAYRTGCKEISLMRRRSRSMSDERVRTCRLASLQVGANCGCGVNFCAKPCSVFAQATGFRQRYSRRAPGGDRDKPWYDRP